MFSTLIMRHRSRNAPGRGQMASESAGGFAAKDQTGKAELLEKDQ
jgi:hypothetical protein